MLSCTVRLAVPPMGLARLHVWGRTDDGRWWAYVGWDEHARYRGRRVVVVSTAWVSAEHVAPWDPAEKTLDVPRLQLLPKPASWPAPVPGGWQEVVHYRGQLTGRPLAPPDGYELA